MFKYPMNRPNLLTLMSQPETASIPVNVKEPFLEFSRLVHQCVYLSEQYFPRFQSLSQNKELVHYICDVIETMECIFGEDIKAFGYSLVLLAYSQDERAERLLAKINEQAIQEKCTLNHVLLSVFKNVDSKEIGVLYKAQRDFHDTLIQEQLLHSGYFQFADAVGLDVSILKERLENRTATDELPDFWFHFSLSTMEGKRYEDGVAEKQRKDWYRLDIMIRSPYDEPAFEIKIESNHIDPRSYTLTQYGPHSQYKYSEQKYLELSIWDSRTSEVYFRDKVGTEFELTNLKEIIADIEKSMGVHFCRRPVSTLFSKGIRKRKNLDKWLAK